MKFRNPKTGEVYDVRADEGNSCEASGFCRDVACSVCPLLISVGTNPCRNWVVAHAEQAAELMGYELVNANEPVCPAVNQPCMKERCGWWNKTKQQCSILLMVDHLAQPSPVEAQPVPRTEFDKLKESWKPCKMCRRCVSCKHSIEDASEFPCNACVGKKYFEPRNVCPDCGRPLTETGWNMLRVHLEGGI